MGYCGKCGTQLEDGEKFCPACGASTEIPEEQGARLIDYGAKLQGLNNTADTTTQFDDTDIQKNRTMAILAYIGILVLVPLFAAKNSRFARYHANQGLVLAIAEIVYGIIYSIVNSIILSISWRLYFITSIIGLIGLVFLILAILGIVNATNGRAKELPVIGKIKLLK